MKLYIDSTDNQKTVISLDNTEYVNSVTNPREQNILRFIQEALTSIGRTPQDITEIEVNPGPGSFTGTRVGVAIANALGYALRLPINNKSILIEPVYSKEASITEPKN